MKETRELTPQEELILMDWEIAKHDAWTFLSNFTFTWDNHDNTDQADCKQFPKKAVYRLICRLWDEKDEVFLKKSRQIMMTWIYSALFLRETMFKKARLFFMQSKKDEDAQDVLNRSRHIYEQLHKLRVAGAPLPGLPKAKMTGSRVGTDAEIEFPENMSTLRAIPQGPDIIRMHTSSGIFSDEMNHQRDFLEGYAAAAQTLTGGAKFVAAGTANGRAGSWSIIHGINDMTGKPEGPHQIESKHIKERLFDIPEDLTPEDRRYFIEDKLINMPDDEFKSVPLEVLAANMPGVDYWQTCYGTDCFFIHYTSDPDKDPVTERGREWMTEAKRRQKSEQKWLREMEGREDTFEGRPVISNWNQTFFVRKPVYREDYPVRLSFDFGTQVNVTTFSQLIKNVDGYENTNQLRYLDELVLTNSNTMDQAAETVKKLKHDYPIAWDNNLIESFCDPNADITSATTSDRSRNSNLKILHTHGIWPSNKKFGVPESTEILETVFCIILPNGEPAVIIHERCDYLISVLGFGLHYPPDGKGREGYYEKDGWFDHGGDTVRYDVANAFDEYDITGKTEPRIRRAVPIRDKYTGRIRGWRRLGPGAVNRRRGEHPVHMRRAG